MSRSNDDRFRLRPGTPKQRGDAFINKVMRQTNKAGATLGKRVAKPVSDPVPGLGRGHVAARFAGASLTPNARRVTIKARLVHLAKVGPRSTATHLRYIEREGVDRQGVRDTPMVRLLTRRTPPLSRSADARIATNSASSSHRKTPNSSTICAPTPGN